MTDRTICLTVTLDKEYRIDDAEEIYEMMIKKNQEIIDKIQKDNNHAV